MDKTTRRRVLATGASAIAVGIAGCSGGGGGGNDGGGNSNVVEMTDDLKYVPESITVSTGTTVTWKNTGTVGHSVTAYEDKIPEGADYWASGGFSSQSAAQNNYPSKGEISGGESFEYTFSTSGTHKYFCIPHETAGMKAEVVVE